MNNINETDIIQLLLYKITSLISYNNDYLKNKYINDIISIEHLNLIKHKELFYIDIIDYYLKVSEDLNTIQIYSNNLINNHYDIIKNDIILINLEYINHYFIELLELLSK
jgi:hypothetical protein